VAIRSGAASVSITSFNEFGEGTQIEPASGRSIDVDSLAPAGLALDWPLRRALGLPSAFPDYEGGPEAYLSTTWDMAQALTEHLSEIAPAMEFGHSVGSSPPQTVLFDVCAAGRAESSLAGASSNQATPVVIQSSELGHADFEL
jgi:hypothetical protein